MYMSHSSTGCFLALVSLAAGYIVLVKASKETKGLRLLGLIIGTIIIAGTLLLGVGKLLCCTQQGTCGTIGQKYPMGHSSSCPIMPGVKK